MRDAKGKKKEPMYNIHVYNNFILDACASIHYILHEGTYVL